MLACLSRTLKRSSSTLKAESSVRSTWPSFMLTWVPARLAAFLSPAHDMVTGGALGCLELCESRAACLLRGLCAVEEE